MKSNQQADELRFDARKIADIDGCALPGLHSQPLMRRPADITTGVLWVVVPYTTPELTQAALRYAGVSKDLNLHVSLVDIQVVPFPCSLNQPPINRDFSEQRLRDLLGQSGLPGRTDVVYARDWIEGFARVLKPESIVILAAKERWRQTREHKLARGLLKAGHQVMLLKV